jgi:pyruvate/oxaloacetate carboxyltransferase
MLKRRSKRKPKTTRKISKIKRQKMLKVRRVMGIPPVATRAPRILRPQAVQNLFCGNKINGTRRD